MIIAFEEKHGTRYIQGDNEFAIFSKVLADRIAEGYWYDDEDGAESALQDGKAVDYMRYRQGYEYEGWQRISVEQA